MKKYILPYVVIPIIIGMSCLSLTAFSQSVPDSTLLGLPGDNLDLYAVLDLFQNSKTIEEFEKSLNLEKTGINNMDLNLDKKVDFIKVVTKQDKDDFTFVLQIAVSEKETQDVAVILVSKDDQKKITMQIVGDEVLYGKNYVVELKESSTPAVTANPGYKGPDTVKVVTQPAKTTTVIVEQAPIVQYVYSPAYVPYVPPYYYGFYPPYFAAFSVMAIGMYWGAHAHYHHGGYGYHGNTTVIHNTNNFNNYNRTRNTSNTVNRNNREGNYSRNNAASTRPSTSDRSRGGASTSDRNRGGASASTREAGPTRDAARNSPSTREAGGAGPTRERAGQTPSNRQSGVSTQPSRSSSNGASRYSGGGSRGSSGYSGGGGHSGGSRGGGFSGGGGARGGGGRRR